MKKWLLNFFHSFGFRLFILHFREHLIVVSIWIVLALIMRGAILGLFGIKYLLLLPEYLGETDPVAFGIIGSAFGALLMTWHLVTYLIYARRFPFLAALGRPFTKFALNNSFLPLFFLLFYLRQIWLFLKKEAGMDTMDTLHMMASFLLGMLLIVLIIALYLALTNKDIRHSPAHQVGEGDAKQVSPDRKKIMGINWGVDNYLSEHLSVRLVRSVSHYDIAVLKGVYQQNHLNALLLQVLSFLMLMSLGFLVDIPLFRIPAGASIFILAAMAMALIGAISFWFGPWRLLVFIGLMGLLEWSTTRSVDETALTLWGLTEESVNPPIYALSTLRQQVEASRVDADRNATELILEGWKSKQRDEKPLFIVLSASGGGSKAAYWTALAIQELEAELGPGFMDKVGLMTGASGGTFGLALMREYFHQQQQGIIPNYTASLYRDQMAADLLNSLAFTMVTTDILLPSVLVPRRFGIFRNDRGVMFEKQFNENTNFVLDKTLKDYREPERQGSIPLLYITPAIVNDGRRLIISSQGVSHLCRVPFETGPDTLMDIDGVDYGYFFEKEGSQSLSMTTALRMNATFPYILPTVALPTSPAIELMDAGIRDNFGISMATRFIQVHKKWLEENTSGILIIHLRCWEKGPEIEPVPNRGILSDMSRPFHIVGAQSRFQDFDHDTNQALLAEGLDSLPLHVARLIYQPGEQRAPASMSFHLTAMEKQDIIEAWNRPHNKQAVQRIKQTLD